MSDDQLTKRARQKQRREALRLEQQRKQARARRIRIGVTGAVLLVVVGLVGFTLQQRRASTAMAAAAAQAAGCTPDTQMADLGGGHLNTPEEMSANPPQALYPDRPPTSGRHVVPVVASGAYDTLIDERSLVHNLEHGYAVVYYAPAAPPDQVTALKNWANAQITGDFPKLIVAPWTGDALPEGAMFAYTAWNFRQVCDVFDPEVGQTFLEAHSGIRSRAPEESLPPHTEEQVGSIAVPDDGNFLFPPLDEQLGDGRPNIAAQGAPPSAVPAPSEDSS